MTTQISNQRSDPYTGGSEPPNIEAIKSGEQAVLSDSRNVNERQNIAFARSTFRFKEALDRVRNKKQQPQFDMEAAAEQSSTLMTKVPFRQDSSNPSSHRERQIKVLRVVQHTLTSVVSMIIATLQALTYAKYQQTKDIPGAWPKSPLLFPTLILLAVAAMALAFDICSLIAYLMPHKPIAQRAFRFAVRLHYWITGVKTLSYVVGATVCRTNPGTGDEKNLWGWSCSEQGKEMNDVNGANGNCTGSKIAWILSILNIVIEVLGLIITWLVKRQDGRSYQPIPDPDAGSSSNAASEKKTAETARYDALESMGDEVHAELKEPESELF